MTNNAYGYGIVKSYQQMQAEYNMYARHLDRAMQAYGVAKLTLDEKINAFIKNAMAHARYRAARKLAGDEWPD